MSTTPRAPEVTAVARKLDELDMGRGNATSPTVAQAAAVAAVAVAAAPATQVRRPWRSTFRTLFQFTVGIAPVLPLIVDASGVDETLPAVGVALAISGGITRVMGLQPVEQFLQRFVPWLAAAPAPKAG